MFTIRDATVADARAIAEVHVDGWRWGYRDILPAAVLDALDVSEREARWVTILGEPRSDEARLVAEDDEHTVVGFVSTGSADGEVAPPPDGAGELFAIYVRDGWQRRGIGRSLHDAAVRELAGAGFGRAVLWVFEANELARRFYETSGWRFDGSTGTHRLGGSARTVLRYAVDL